MIACMVPKGNMMQCMLKKVDDGFELIKFAISKRLPPVEIIQMESELADFFSVGVETIAREGERSFEYFNSDEINNFFSGENLRISRKGMDYVFLIDKNIRK